MGETNSQMGQPLSAFRRHALYFTPPDGPLARFGAAWLGRDLWQGRDLAHPDLPGLPSGRIAELTETPRRYGFHATLKPPFRLAEGQTEAELLTHLHDICRQLAPVTLTGGLRLAGLNGFAALVPAQPSPALQNLAAEVVRGFEPFRAPLTEAEIARRRPERLTAAQRANLRDWGYPWVMEDFRFHMTLTGRLRAGELNEVLARLAPALQPVLPDRFEIDALTLCGEDRNGRFHAITRVALTGGSSGDG